MSHRPRAHHRLVLALIVVAVLALPSRAAAAQVTVNGGVLFFQAPPGEDNRLTISFDAGYRVTDTGAPLTPSGSACAAVSVNIVTCDATDVASILVFLGDRDDQATIDPSVGGLLGADLEGEGGSDTLNLLGGPFNFATLEGHGAFGPPGGPADNDVLTGGPFDEVIIGENGNDRLNGGGGQDQLDGEDGDDTIDGGPGDDSLRGGGAGNGADRLIGGPGVDSLDFQGRGLPVTITQNGDADDGGSGEGDNVGSDIETLIGGKGDDTISGGGVSNTIFGSFGDDVISGGAGADRTIQGNEGNDLLNGDAGDDVGISGGAGNDRVSGGAGNDFILGSFDEEPGIDDDELNGGPGVDTVSYFNAGLAFSSAGLPLSLSLDNVANDGAGDHDNIGSNVEDLVGGPGPDRLRGNSAANQLDGGSGDDRILGGGGNDALNGERGADRLAGGRGQDLLAGGAGPDSLTSRGGGADEVSCGGSVDLVRGDRSDRIRGDCERVELPGRAK
jgi:Ca2+-binding RTX toxin-like protein